jgi:hypothetical protein
MALEGFTERDPAERSAFNRLFYRNRRPTWLGHWVSQFFCWWARVGLPPRSWVALQIRDRLSGRLRQDAVVIPSVAGEQYVVSMFGTISDWVRNVEAADGDAAISHGGTQRVRLVLVPPDKRAPILSEYVRVASSGRKHFRCRWERRWPMLLQSRRSIRSIASSCLLLGAVLRRERDAQKLAIDPKNASFMPRHG